MGDIDVRSTAKQVGKVRAYIHPNPSARSRRSFKLKLQLFLRMNIERLGRESQVGRPRSTISVHDQEAAVYTRMEPDVQDHLIRLAEVLTSVPRPSRS